MEVDHDNCITSARIGLWVPTKTPAIAETALRTSVDQERNRVLFAFFIVRRFDHITMNSFIIPTLEVELLELPELLVLQT